MVLHFTTLLSYQSKIPLDYLAVDGCAALEKLLEPHDCVARILPVIVSFSQVITCIKYLHLSDS